MGLGAGLSKISDRKDWFIVKAFAYTTIKDMIVGEINAALSSIDEDQVARLIEDICGAEKVFFTGVGRVKMSLEAFAKRLSHLGINANVVGDTTEPAITERDLLIVGSGSGESIIPVAIAGKAKEFNAKVVHIGSNPNGKVAHYADYMVRIPVRTRLYLEDEVDSKQIMTSLFEQSLLILGDIIASIIVDEKGIDLRGLWQYHANLE